MCEESWDANAYARFDVKRDDTAWSLARNKCGYAPRDAHADQSRQQTITANEIERLKNATRRTSETRDAAMKRKGYVTNGHRYLRLPDIKA
jgi:hypothetical protein